MHTRISPHEAAKLSSKTVKIPGEENQYLTQLEVYHQLHCLDLIRKALYVSEVERYHSEFKDYIGPDLRKNFKGKDADHIGKSSSLKDLALNRPTSLSFCSSLIVQIIVLIGFDRHFSVKEKLRRCLGLKIQYLGSLCHNCLQTRFAAIWMLSTIGRKSEM